MFVLIFLHVSRLFFHKLPRQSLQRHVLRNYVVGDERILPSFAAASGRVIAGLFAPRYRHIAFSEHSRVFHFVLRLGFEHVNAISRFGNEVGLVFRIVGALFVVNQELPFRGLEPLLCFTIQYHRKLALGV